MIKGRELYLLLWLLPLHSFVGDEITCFIGPLNKISVPLVASEVLRSDYLVPVTDYSRFLKQKSLRVQPLTADIEMRPSAWKHGVLLLAHLLRRSVHFLAVNVNSKLRLLRMSL